MRKWLSLLCLILLPVVANAQGVEASRLRRTTFSNLGTPANGNTRYCSDCAATSPCTGSGSGAVAERVNGAWNCSVGGGTGNVIGPASATDNAVARFNADATHVQNSGVIIDDSNNVSGVGTLSASNLAPGFATTATAAGTTTLTVASKGVQEFTGSTTQTVTLPVVSTLPQTGFGFLVINQSSGIVTVQSSGGNSVQSMATGTSAIFTCAALTGTGASSWTVSYIAAGGGGISGLTTGQHVVAASSTTVATDGVKRYVALLTQSGTSAPVATVLENSLGGTLVWARDDAGAYHATLAGAFTANKTSPVSQIVIGPGSSAPVTFDDIAFASGSRDSNDVFVLTTVVANANVDDVLNQTLVVILVGP